MLRDIHDEGGRSAGLPVNFKLLPDRLSPSLRLRRKGPVDDIGSVLRQGSALTLPSR